ncbi:MAG: hypothetical protein V4623_03425 [Pseudomonadota bacterium]
MTQQAEDQATTRASPSFWRDLNVFIAAFAGLASMGIFVIVVPLSLLAKLVVPDRQAELITYPLSYAVIASVLIYWWWKHGLSPRERNPARERRFRWGHIVLVVFNLSLLMMFVPALFGSIAVVPPMPAVASLLLPLITLAPMGVIAGLLMLWTSREKTPVFTETLPSEQGDWLDKQRTKLAFGSRDGTKAIAPLQPSSVPSTIVVVAGLIASSFMLFVATVFGSLAFQGNPARFTNVVLPILLVIYVLYGSTAVFLLTKRRGSAVWVAWAPVGLLVVGLPALQVILMLFGAVFGR